jgi:mono/diheme cytochrome c family protein
VLCHQINGVGGLAGPALDAQEPAGVFDPLDFAARMWRGAWAMADLQATEFGDVIMLSGQEIADIAAFAENHELQKRFSLDEVPEIMRAWIVDGYDEDAPPRP